MPALSIITVNLNNCTGLQKTLDSVFAQTFTDYEYLLIDGGSTDGSAVLIKKNENRFVYCACEKDNGIYHAMNKGIRKATGDYLLFLNSGDYLLNKEVVSQLMSASENKDIVYGQLVIDAPGKQFIKEYPEHLNFSFFLQDTLPHPCTLIKRNLFERIGLYNENLRTTSDWQFFLIAVCTYNVSYKRLSLPVAVFTTDGVSSREDNRSWIQEDKKQVLQKYYPAFLDDYRRLEEYESGLKDCRQQLVNIENSRLWKLRKRLAGLGMFQFFLKK